MGFLTEFIRRERNGNRDKPLPKIKTTTEEVETPEVVSMQQKQNYASKDALFENIAEDDDQYWIELYGTYYCFPERFAVLVDRAALMTKIAEAFENEKKYQNHYNFYRTEFDTIKATVHSYVKYDLMVPQISKRHEELLSAYVKNSFLTQEEFQGIKVKLEDIDHYDYVRFEHYEDISSVDMEKALSKFESDFIVKAYRLELNIRCTRISRIRSGAIPRWKGYKPSRLTKGKKRV